MLKKKIIICIIAAVMLLTFSFNALAASPVHYASIPRPVNSDMVKYVISDNSYQTNPTIYRISTNVLDVDSNGIKYYFAATQSDVTLYAYNINTVSMTVFIDRFSINGTLMNTYKVNVPSGGLANAVVLLNYDSTYVSYLDIGDIPLQEGAEFATYGLPSIAWSDNTDPATYESWLSSILDALRENKNMSEEIISNQNQNTQDIIDNEQQMQEEEKSEANVEGSGGVSDIISGVDDKGPGFFNAISGLVQSLSYNGTEAKWELPELKLPALHPSWSDLKVFENSEIDFNEWLSKIPENIVTVARAISTIGLVVFCFKELYNTIQYVLTLRGG